MRTIEGEVPSELWVEPPRVSHLDEISTYLAQMKPRACATLHPGHTIVVPLNLKARRGHQLGPEKVAGYMY